ncbi:hypothetical protein HFD88_009004 [Aspergillus terreus]|nr:hypothetical protein HFD88_009004 [Aspergillus terreus]
MSDSVSGLISPAIPVIRQSFFGSVLFSGGTVDNEATVNRVSDIALSFARADAHCVAPSDMSDGRIRAIKP